MVTRLSCLALLLLACAMQSEPPEDLAAQDRATDMDMGMAGPDRFAELARIIRREQGEREAPGVAVAIVQKGRLAWSAGFGSKHPDKNDPVKATTLFRIGSVTKMFTAAALLQRVAAGQVDTKDKVVRHLPEFALSGDPRWASSITVQHLLTHASGLNDHLLINWPDKDDSALASYLLGKEYAASAYLLAPAGRMWNYSNPNFMLAGLLIERTSGLPYRTYLRDRLLSPLSMGRTYFLGSEVLADGDFAYGKTVDWEGGGGPVLVAPDTYENVWARPAGYAYSSVLDLARFAIFLMGSMEGADAVLPAAQVQAMQAHQLDTESFLDLQHYGYGLLIAEAVFVGTGDFRRFKLVFHGGAIPGFSADLYMVPSSGFAMAVLANTDGAYFNQSVAAALVSFADLPPPSRPPELTDDPARYDAYAGAYLDPFNIGPVTIKRSGDKLLIDAPALDMAMLPYEKELRPLSKRNFIFRVQGFDLGVTFILDAEGKAEYLRSRVAVARRVTGMALARAQVPALDRRKLLGALRRNTTRRALSSF